MAKQQSKGNGKSSTNPLRVALYARVSTSGQTVANQLEELKAVAKRSGWQIVQIQQDEGISGTKGRAQRPALDALLKCAARREFDMVAAWSVDRLGRSLQDLIVTLAELQALGVDLYLHQQAVDTTTPAGRALFQMMGVFAEFERAMIRERIHAGLARARAQGKRLGRPPVDGEIAERIVEALAAGNGIRTTARICGVSSGTVRRIRAQS